jgi:hypothetical protein
LELRHGPYHLAPRLVQARLEIADLRFLLQHAELEARGALFERGIAHRRRRANASRIARAAYGGRIGLALLLAAGRQEHRGQEKEGSHVGP